MTYGLRGNNAIGIGSVNSIANVSGWIGPIIEAAAYLNGFLRTLSYVFDILRHEASGGYVLGFLWQGGLLILLISCILLILHWNKKQGITTQTYPTLAQKVNDCMFYVLTLFLF